MEGHLWIKAWIDDTFMFMSPDNQVEEVWKKVFREVTCFGVGVALRWLASMKS